MTRLASVLVLLLAHASVAATVTEVHYVMGTYFHITAEHGDPQVARAALRHCFADTRTLESHFSRFDPASELSQLNATGTPAVAVSDDMADLLLRSLQLQQLTRGTFNVAVGSLTALWRSATRWPSATQLAAARAGLGGDALLLQDRELIRQPGVRIDLDGVAKGFAVDRCAAQLRSAGIARALLSFGESSLYALGAPAGARGWTVTVRSLATDRALGTLTLRDQAASISAVFGHERRLGSRRIGHIVNPHTGEPLTAPAIAVVVAASATDAEAFSKALLVDDGLASSVTLSSQGTDKCGWVRSSALTGGSKPPAESDQARQGGSKRGVCSPFSGLGPTPPGDSISGRSRSRGASTPADQRGRDSTRSLGERTDRCDHCLSGALLIRPDGIRRIGTIAFTAWPHPTRIAAAAEPLR